MKLIKMLAMLAGLSTLSGCITAGAILTSGEAMRLKPEPDRYLKLTARVHTETGTHEIEFGWSCENKRVLSLATGHWQLQWKDAAPEYVVRQVAANEVVFFHIKPYAFCGTEGEKPYLSGFAQMAGGSSDKLLVFDEPKTSAYRVEGTVARLSQPYENPRENEQERAVRRLIASEFPNFKALNVGLWDKDAWSKSTGYSKYIADHNISGQIHWTVCNSCALSHPTITAQLQPQAVNAVPTAAANLPASSSIFYKTEITKKPISVCIAEECLSLTNPIGTYYFAGSEKIARFYYRDFYHVHIPE